MKCYKITINNHQIQTEAEILDLEMKGHHFSIRPIRWHLRFKQTSAFPKEIYLKTDSEEVVVFFKEKRWIVEPIPEPSFNYDSNIDWRQSWSLDPLFKTDP